MPASIEDVAKKANVSISTVSRVVNRGHMVNVETRKRVEKVIESLGYRPNVFARGLMLKKSNILSLVLPDLHGEFYSEIIRGASQKSRELGYNLLLSAVSASDDGKDILSTVGTHGLVDGIAVMVSEMNSKICSSLKSSELPIVLLDGDAPGVKHDSIVIDHKKGAKSLVHHIVSSHPNDRIVFIGGLETNLDTIDRLAAFKEVLSESNKVPDESDIFHLDYSYETAFNFAVDRVLQWASRPTTIFAANDEMAAGVIDAAISSTLTVPKDIRVVGFDDTRIAQLTRPRLTTVRVPMVDMGAMAIELLCRRLDEPDRSTTQVTLNSELVVRESCGLSP